jgi:Flp pilus assembly pilin Flp
MVAQAAREGVGEVLRPAPETVDRPWIAGEGAEREGVRRPQQQMPGRGGVWQQAAREESHRRGKMVPWGGDASGCLDLRPWSSMSWEAPESRSSCGRSPVARFWTEEDGATMVEYGMLVLMMTIAGLIVSRLGEMTNVFYNTVSATIASVL